MPRAMLSLPLAVLIVGLVSPSAYGHFTIIAVSGETPPRGTGVIAEGLGLPALNDNGQAAFTGNLRDNGFLSGGGVFRGNGTPGNLTVIMLKGDTTPGLNGNIGEAENTSPSLNINSQDQVAVLVGLTGTLGGGLDSEAIYRGDGTGALTQIARLNDLVPGNDGRFLSFGPYPISLNDAGQVAFFAGLRETTDNLAVYRGDGTDLTQIVRIKRPAPGSEFTFSFLDGTRVALNASGQVLFSGLGTDNAAQAFQGIFRGDGSSTVAIARQGDSAPDGNGTFLSPSITFVAFNDAGQAAFVPLLQDTDQGAIDNLGIFRGDGNTMVKIARKGDLLPDQNGRFLDFSQTPVLNNQGQALFLASISGGAGGSDEGIFIGDGATTKIVARINDPVPRGAGRFSDFGAYALNDEGQAAFFARIDLEDGGGTNDTFGLFFYDPVDGLSTVARNGDQLPTVGEIGSINFAGGPTALTDARNGFNDLGQVAFQCFAGQNVAVVVWSAPDDVTTTTTSTTTTTITTTTTSTTTTTTLAGAPACAQPITTGSTPTASDCLFILRTAVGSATCLPSCVCDANGDAHATATDALLCLKKAVGQNVELNCPCGPNGSTTTTLLSK